MDPKNPPRDGRPKGPNSKGLAPKGDGPRAARPEKVSPPGVVPQKAGPDDPPKVNAKAARAAVRKAQEVACWSKHGVWSLVPDAKQTAREFGLLLLCAMLCLPADVGSGQPRLTQCWAWVGDANQYPTVRYPRRGPAPKKRKAPRPGEVLPDLPPEPPKPSEAYARHTSFSGKPEDLREMADQIPEVACVGHVGHSNHPRAASVRSGLVVVMLNRLFAKAGVGNPLRVLDLGGAIKRWREVVGEYHSPFHVHCVNPIGSQGGDLSSVSDWHNGGKGGFITTSCGHSALDRNSGECICAGAWEEKVDYTVTAIYSAAHYDVRYRMAREVYAGRAAYIIVDTGVIRGANLHGEVRVGPPSADKPQCWNGIHTDGLNARARPRYNEPSTMRRCTLTSCCSDWMAQGSEVFDDGSRSPMTVSYVVEREVKIAGDGSSVLLRMVRGRTEALLPLETAPPAPPTPPVPTDWISHPQHADRMVLSRAVSLERRKIFLSDLHVCEVTNALLAANAAEARMADDATRTSRAIIARHVKAGDPYFVGSSAGMSREVYHLALVGHVYAEQDELARLSLRIRSDAQATLTMLSYTREGVVEDHVARMSARKARGPARGIDLVLLARGGVYPNDCEINRWFVVFAVCAAVLAAVAEDFLWIFILSLATPLGLGVIFEVALAVIYGFSLALGETWLFHPAHLGYKASLTSTFDDGGALAARICIHLAKAVTYVFLHQDGFLPSLYLCLLLFGHVCWNASATYTATQDRVPLTGLFSNTLGFFSHGFCQVGCAFARLIELLPPEEPSAAKFRAKLLACDSAEYAESVASLVSTDRLRSLREHNPLGGAGSNVPFVHVKTTTPPADPCFLLKGSPQTARANETASRAVMRTATYVTSVIREFPPAIVVNSNWGLVAGRMMRSRAEIDTEFDTPDGRNDVLGCMFSGLESAATHHVTRDSLPMWPEPLLPFEEELNAPGAFSQQQKGLILRAHDMSLSETNSYEYAMAQKHELVFPYPPSTPERPATKKSRGVNSQPPVVAMHLLPAVKALERWTKRVFSASASGVAMPYISYLQQGAMFTRLVDSGIRVVLEADYSNFDAAQGAAAQAFTYLLLVGMTTISIWPTALAVAVAVFLRPAVARLPLLGTVTGWFEPSGRWDTTVANTLRNLAWSFLVSIRLWGRPVLSAGLKVWAAGDDSLVFLPPEVATGNFGDWQAAMRCAGLEATGGFKPIATAGFCSKLYWPVSEHPSPWGPVRYLPGPLIGKACYKLGATVLRLPLAHLRAQKHADLKAGTKYTQHVPILRVLVHHTLRVTQSDWEVKRPTAIVEAWRREMLDFEVGERGYKEALPAETWRLMRQIYGDHDWESLERQLDDNLSRQNYFLEMDEQFWRFIFAAEDDGRCYGSVEEVLAQGG